MPGLPLNGGLSWSPTKAAPTWFPAGKSTTTEFLIHLNYTPEMAALYEQVFAGWEAVNAGVFVAFLDVSRPSQYGSWGHLRHLGDSNPRWDALVAARDRAKGE